MPDTFESLLVKLHRAGVDYLVAGGVTDFLTTARRLEIGDVTVRYLDPEALIELKASSDRDKDKLDVSALRALLDGTVHPRTVDLVELTPPASAAPEDLP